MEFRSNSPDRRRFLEQSLKISAAGLLAGMSLEEQALLAWAEEDGETVGGAKAGQVMASGKIGKLAISRLVCGGNLFSGFAHSRDLIYVSALMKQYFTPEKIMDTLQACEENGVNTAIMRCDEHIVGILKRYRKERGGRIQWIAQTYPKQSDLTGNIQMAVDNGAVGAFVQGGIGDRFVADGLTEQIGKVLAFMRQNGLVAGVGSHSLETPQVVEKEKLDPDFYFKTFNSVDYCSQKPQQVADLMKTIAKPWIAFKVLGAGTVHPRAGFRLALEKGADFLNVGMFDFQVRENAAVMNDLLARDLPTTRQS
jgi:hypothetical protein